MMTLDGKTKWAFLGGAPAEDAQSPELAWLAGLLRQAAAASPWPGWAMAQLAMCCAQDLIVYVLDRDRIGREQIPGLTEPQGSRLEALQRGTGDCKSKARLFVGLCLAAGVQARMCPKWRGDTLEHVFAEVYVAGPYDEGKRKWYTVETILDRAKLGDPPQAVPTEKDTHRWRMSSTGRAA